MPAHKFNFVLFDAEALGTGATLTTGIIPLQYVPSIIGLALRAVSAAGAADVRVEMQSSHDGTNFDDEDDRADISSSTATDRPNNTEGWNIYSVPAPVNNFIRFTIDELAAVADTVIDARLVCEENVYG